jgi:hypothetical protein
VISPKLVSVLLRIELDTDKHTARRIMELHKKGRRHHESREAAREEALRRGRTPAGDPVFVGITNGEPARLIYDVPVHAETTS